MSKYTTELRYVCESLYPYRESKGYNDVNDILEETWDKVFDFDFPIFDENYRKPLCKKILKHYYTREICEETYGLWKLRLDAEMNEIMPYFNKLYDSELITISPLINYRVNTAGNNRKTGSDSVGGTEDRTDRTVGNVSSGRYGGYTDSHTGTDTMVKSGSESLAKSGKESDTKTGNEELAKTGTEKKEYSGTESITKSGTEETAKTGTEDRTRTGKETEGFNNYKDTRTIEGGYSDKNELAGEKVNEHSVTEGDISTTDVNLFTDTPQGDIINMGDNYGGNPPTSDVPIVGTDTAYLTTVEKNISTTKDNRVIKDKTYGEHNYADTTTRDYHGKDSNSKYTEETEKSGSKDKTYTNVKDSTTFTNRKDTTTYNNRSDTKSFNDREDDYSFINRKDTTTYNNVKNEKSFTDREDTTTYNNVQNQETKNLTDSRTYNQQDNSESTVNKVGSTTELKTTTYNNTNAYIDSIVGSKGKSDSELLMEFRQTFLNIDAMILKQLSDLFIMLW